MDLTVRKLKCPQSLEIADHPYVDTTELKFSGVTFGLKLLHRPRNLLKPQEGQAYINQGGEGGGQLSPLTKATASSLVCVSQSPSEASTAIMMMNTL